MAKKPYGMTAETWWLVSARLEQEATALCAWRTVAQGGGSMPLSCFTRLAHDPDNGGGYG
ncbi:MAG: hypothetical protein ABF530_01500 [Acetobacter orientalis]